MTALVLAGAVLFALVALGVWARRGELQPDPPGVRTLCTFSGDDEDGARLLGGIAGELRMRGATTDDPSQDSDLIWSLAVHHEGAASDLQLAHVEADDYDWVLTAVDPSSGGPCARALLPVLAAVLSSLAVRDVVWHRRDLFARNDYSSARPTPLD
jgi:hypothetical protein